MQNAKIKINPPKLNELTNKITERFNYDKIINEVYYLRRMSPKFMIHIDILIKDQLFKNLTNAQAMQVIQAVPFFILSKNHVQISYHNPERVLIVSGIKKDKLKEWMEAWNR